MPLTEHGDHRLLDNVALPDDDLLDFVDNPCRDILDGADIYTCLH
jgi:hypothetical protein